MCAWSGEQFSRCMHLDMGGNSTRWREENSLQWFMRPNHKRFRFRTPGGGMEGCINGNAGWHWSGLNPQQAH